MSPRLCYIQIFRNICNRTWTSHKTVSSKRLGNGSHLLDETERCIRLSSIENGLSLCINRFFRFSELQFVMCFIYFPFSNKKLDRGIRDSCFRAYSSYRTVCCYFNEPNLKLVPNNWGQFAVDYATSGWPSTTGSRVIWKSLWPESRGSYCSMLLLVVTWHLWTGMFQRQHWIDVERLFVEDESREESASVQVS